MEEGGSLVAGRQHPLTRRRPLPSSDREPSPWVMPLVNTLLREPLERAFEDHGLAMPANRIETLSVHVLRAYLHHTSAIAALAANVSSYYESLGLLAILPLDLPKLVRPVGVMCSRQRPVAAGMEALIGGLGSGSGPARSPEAAGDLPELPPGRARPSRGGGEAAMQSPGAGPGGSAWQAERLAAGDSQREGQKNKKGA